MVNKNSCIVTLFTAGSGEISFLPVLDIGTGVGLINTLDVLDLAAEEYQEVYGDIIVPKEITS